MERLPISKLANNTGQIKGVPANPRTIDKDDYQKLLESIQKDPEYLEHEMPHVIAHGDKYVVLNGNQRLRALRELKFTETPVTIYKPDTPPEVIRARIIKSNHGYGKDDFDMLANDVWSDDPLDAWGLDTPDDWGEDKEVEEDESPEVDESEPPKSKLGEVYQLGRHRVGCMDSTVKENVEKLMDGNKADMVFTDPPYGVDIKGKFTGKIQNDNLKGDELQSFLGMAFALLKEYCKGSIYISYEVLNQKEFNDAFGSKPDEVIIWVKDSASFYSDNKYNRRFEPIAYYSNGKELKTKAETNVWEFAKSSSFNSRDENGLRFNEAGNYLVAHPTTKPVGLVSRAINNSSAINNKVLDLFLGSGSTLIACEQTDRTCYGMELSEQYVDVIRKRYWKFINDGDEEGWEDGTPTIK